MDETTRNQITAIVDDVDDVAVYKHDLAGASPDLGSGVRF